MLYITCEGRHQWFHGIYFNLLSCLRHDNIPVNLPHFLFSLLSKRAMYVQEGKPKSVLNHCLIKLLVEKDLNQVYFVSWDDFLLMDKLFPSSAGLRGSRVGRRVTIETRTIKIMKWISFEKPSGSCETPR